MRNGEGFRACKISKQIISQWEMKSGEKEKKPLKNIYAFVTALAVDYRRESYLNIYTYQQSESNGDDDEVERKVKNDNKSATYAN